MSTERLKHLSIRENLELRHIRERLMILGEIGDRLMEQTVQERDLQLRQTWLKTKNSVLGFVKTGGKKTEIFEEAVSAGVDTATEKVADLMTNWWEKQQASKSKSDQARQARWVKDLEKYEVLKLKEASGKELEIRETVEMRDIESELSTRQAQQFVLEALTATKEQLAQISETFNVGTKKLVPQFNRYVSVLAIASTLLAACAGRDQQTPTPTPIEPTPTTLPTQTPEPSPTPYPDIGPEATPAHISYPESLSSQEVLDGMNFNENIPDDLLSDPDVIEIIRLRKEWLANSNMGGKLTIISWGQGDSFRWDVLVTDNNGKLTGWLILPDENTLNGYRFAERPSWDSKLKGTDITPFYNLPEPLTEGNYFEMAIYKDELPVLVEFDKNGNPIRWLNPVTQNLEWLSDVDKSPYEEPTPIPEKVYLAGVTESELKEAISGCRFCKIQEGSFAGDEGHTFTIKVRYLDKYVSQDIIDPNTGTLIATIKAILAASRGNDGNPVLVLIPMQAVNVSTPGINELSGLMNYARLAIGIDSVYSTNKETISDEEFDKFVSKSAGKYAKFIFPIDDTLRYSEYQEIVDTLFKIPDYGDKVANFAKEALPYDNNKPIILWPRGYSPLKDNGEAQY